MASITRSESFGRRSRRCVRTTPCSNAARRKQSVTDAASAAQYVAAGDTLNRLQLADLLSGSVVIETLFGWLGWACWPSRRSTSRDYPVVQGVVTVDTIIVVLMNLLVDLSYGWLDPRVRRRVFA